MALLLAALSSAVFGVSDFFGGLASRRADVLGVVLIAQTTGVVALMALLWPAGGSLTAADTGWGAAGGLAGTIGLLLFYSALAAGVMATVAPITAVVGAVVPLAYGLATGDRFGPAAGIGVVLGLTAITLVSASGAASDRAGGGIAGRVVIAQAVLAGVGFGTFFVLLSRTGDDAGLWPLLAARSTSLPFVAVALVVTGSRLPRRRDAVLPSVGAGADIVANVLFLLAVRTGSLSIVSVLSSLYPATTVVLARLVLHERLGPVRIAGLATAGAAVVLISLGS